MIAFASNLGYNHILVGRVVYCNSELTYFVNFAKHHLNFLLPIFIQELGQTRSFYIQCEAIGRREAHFSTDNKLLLGFHLQL